MQLRELQAAFAAAVTTQGMDAIAPSIVANGMDSAQRLAVYRNNRHHNLREALRAVYPVIERLVGTPFFDYAADGYIGACASISGDIHRYGDAFPAFLSGFRPAAPLAYLPDTARLEWAMHEAFHAAEHAPLALDRLGRLPQADYGRLGFMLHPACRLLSSPFPVHAIWAWNQPDAARDGELDIAGGGACLLVRRSGHAVELLPLEAAEFLMLKALSDGQPIDAAFESAAQAKPGFALAPFILRHVGMRTLVDFRIVQAGSGQALQCE